MFPSSNGFVKLALLATVIVSPAFALDGQIGIHDPSTVIQCDGKYYVYGTGGNGLVSDDGWAWHRGTALPRRGLAPDVIMKCCDSFRKIRSETAILLAEQDVRVALEISDRVYVMLNGSVAFHGTVPELREAKAIEKYLHLGTD